MSSRLYSLAKLTQSSNSISLQKKVSDRSIFTWLQKTTGSLGEGVRPYKRVWGCATGWGRISRTELTIIGLNFE